MRSYLLVALSLLPLAAYAAEPLPLEITADNALEWNQTNKTYIARGVALAKQGDASVQADTLTATYAGKDGSTSDIIQLNADGHVTLTSGTDVATGDNAVYDLVTGEAVLTGKRPKIVQNNKNTLEADKITIWTIPQGQAGAGTLDHAEADGNVLITTDTQIATSDTATYNAPTTIVELIGNVKVKQDKNWLQGDKAEMNLTTHINKMTNKKGTERVKGVFYPGAGKKR
jgi:lipopolysaccharide export system protein LptA